MKKPLTQLPPDAKRIQRWSLLVGIVGICGMIAGVLVDPAQFFASYLAAYVFCLNIPLGCMVLLMIYHLTGGAWGFLIRRLLEAGTRTLPLLAVLFLPIAAGLPYLYLWARPEVVEGNELLRQQHVYMNPTLFLMRAAVYFAVWLLFAWLLNRWSRAQERGAGGRITDWLNTLSGIGLALYGISIHFASVDWILSLQPEYHSTICGPLMASQQLLCGMSAAVLAFIWLHGRPPFAEIVSAKVMNDLGNLLLTFVVLWTYMGWFEYMLTWIANLPADVIWYVDRLRGFWGAVAVALVLLQFAIPFVLLLQRNIKRRPRALASIAVLSLAMQWVFVNFQVLPPIQTEVKAIWWMPFIAPLAIGGIWLALFIRCLNRRPLLVEHDANRNEAERLREADDHELQWEESLAHG